MAIHVNVSIDFCVSKESVTTSACAPSGKQKARSFAFICMVMYVYHIVTTECNIASMNALRDYYSSAVLVLWRKVVVWQKF